jgi:hypothetical protein
MAEGMVSKMKRTIILGLVLAFAMFQTMAAQSTLRRVFDDLSVDVWTDKDDGTNYYEGDPITIYFRASADCYITVYDLDTRGNINLIFPDDPSGKNYVHGGEIYMIPDKGDDFELTVDGPPGNEHIVAAASVDMVPVPDWRGPVSVYDNVWGFKYDGDDENFIKQVNDKYFGGDKGVAFDDAKFYVAPKYYYKPERADCSGDCGQVYVDYPNGCDVYVDGVFYGVAPLYLPGIFLGRHRITVYWSNSIVYNDWILVDAWTPFFVYTRPYYMYHYCYDHWYRNYAWDSYRYGPSHYKYKNANFYTHSRPESRRGYEIITNDHYKYGKSTTYVKEKTDRLEKYKAEGGYDVKTRTFTDTKSRGVDRPTDKKYYTPGSEEKTRKPEGGRSYFEPKSGTVDSKPGSRGGFEKKTRGAEQGTTVKKGEPSTKSGGRSGDNGSSTKKDVPVVKQKSGDSGGGKSSPPPTQSSGKSGHGGSGGKKK